MNIDTHAVLAAAATKWNFLPFKPGLVGGTASVLIPLFSAKSTGIFIILKLF
jgi:UDP-N-acetyl-D-galactosamine dehydrogenase